MKFNLFSHMNWIDWLLAAAFTGVLSVLAGLFLPSPGWALGTVTALFLLVLAKRRRDSILPPPSDPPQ